MSIDTELAFSMAVILFLAAAVVFAAVAPWIVRT